MDGSDTDANWAPQSPNLSSCYSAADDEPEHPQHRGYRGSVSHSLPYSPPTSSSPVVHAKHTPFPPALMPRGFRTEESMQDADYAPDLSEKSRGKRRDGNGSGSGSGGASSSSAAAAATLPPGAEDIHITVHFPVARIKRIMQADDDVGKVAQVTPVVVCTSRPTRPFSTRRQLTLPQPKHSNSS